MKNGIIFLVVTALVIVILLFSYKIIKNIDAQKKIDDLYSRPKRGRGFVLRVLETAFGGKVIHDAVVPVKAKSGYVEPAAVDALMVTRAGVIVITILNVSGKLENPQNGKWRVLDVHGNVNSVDNPFTKNQYMVEVLKRLLRKDGFHNISFHSLVIISNGKTVIPKFTYRNMLTEKNMLDAIKNIMLEKQLSFTEMKDVQNTISRNLELGKKNGAARKDTMSLPPKR